MVRLSCRCTWGRAREWHPTPGVEFYVDCWFCSDLNDDSCHCREGWQRYLPDGCGHVEEGMQFSRWSGPPIGDGRCAYPGMD